MRITFRVYALVVLVLTVLIGGCGLASEPEIVRQLPSPTPAVTQTPAQPDLGYPSARLNLTNGAAIFASPQGCQPCHGLTGVGDGPVALSFTCPMPDLTDLEASQDATLQDWFTITSNGNAGPPTCLMPPWRTRLDEQQRWDVTAYIFSLRYTPDMLARGAAIWAETCAACHGSRGAGDGPEAADQPRPVPDLSDPAYLIARSDADLWRVLTDGIPALGDDAHRFDDQLADDERWAVVAYARSLSWDGVEVSDGLAPAATEEAGPPTPAPTSIAAAPIATPAPASVLTVRGALRSGTPGLVIPDAQPVTLTVITLDASGRPVESTSLETTAGPDGTFSFDGVPRDEGHIFILTTEFEGEQQFSLPAQPGPDSALEMPFTVYGVSDDPAIISIDIQRIFIEFTAPGTARIQHAMRFRNTGDRLYVSDAAAPAGERGGVQIDLPVGAQNVTVSADLAQQYAFVAGETSRIRGVFPVAPGEAPVFQGAYTVTFSGDLNLRFANRYPIGALAVNVPQIEGTTLQGMSFIREDPIALQTGVYDSYLSAAPIQAGAGVAFTVVLGGGVSGLLTGVLIGAVIAIVAVLGGSFVVWRLSRRSRPRTEAEGSRVEELVAAIAALDEAHEAGEVDEVTYQAERDRLKTELAQALADERA